MHSFHLHAYTHTRLPYVFFLLFFYGFSKFIWIRFLFSSILVYFCIGASGWLISDFREERTDKKKSELRYNDRTELGRWLFLLRHWKYTHAFISYIFYINHVDIICIPTHRERQSVPYNHLYCAPSLLKNFFYVCMHVYILPYSFPFTSLFKSCQSLCSSTEEAKKSSHSLNNSTTTTVALLVVQKKRVIIIIKQNV